LVEDSYLLISYQMGERLGELLLNSFAESR